MSNSGQTSLHLPSARLWAAWDGQGRLVTVEDVDRARGHVTSDYPDHVGMAGIRFVAQLTPAAVEVLAALCRHAPEVTYEELQADVQAQLGISPTPIERDKDRRRYRIEPVAAELLSLGAVERARAAGLVAGRGWADA